MHNLARFLKAVSFSLVVLFAFSSCQGRDQAKEAATQANPAVTDTSPKGMVTFLCGAATMTVGGSSAALDIGTAVPVDATVTTDKDGVCEIQFADFGSIHIAEGSTLVVKKFVADSTHTESEMQLTAGKVVCKVKKLSGDDSFQIRTPEMVCGVRGTVFQVSREENKPVKIAVSEGSVAVYPPSVGTTDKLAAPIAEEVHECAPVVAAGQEAAVTAEKMQALDQTLTTIVAAAESDPDKASKESVTAYKKIAASVLKEVAPVSPEAKEVFTEASNLVLGTTPAWQPGNAAVDQGAAQGATQGTAQSAAQSVPAAAHVPAKIRVIVTVDPADAKTTINGTATFKGSFSGIYDDGMTLGLKVESEGFCTVEDSVSVSGNQEIQKTIHLEKKADSKPEAKAEPQKPKAPSFFAIAPQKLVSVAVASGGTYYASDSKSVVYAVSADGKVLWSAKTANGTNSINPPVLGASCVAFMGDKVLSVFDAASGKSLWSLNLDKSNTGLYGRHAAIAKDKLWLTGDSGIAVYDLKTGSPAGTAAFDDGSDMSPAFSGGKVHVVSKTGVWHAINADTLAMESSLETGAIQPVASAPVVRGNTLVFADRKGTVTAIDTAKASIVWQAKLDESRSVDVFVDPVVTANAVYVFAKGKLYALALASGKPLFPAIDATSQGCVACGSLWVGGAGSLSALSPASGASVKKIAVPAAVSGTPAVAGTNLIAPLANGQIMVTGIE
jgi:hypothetical protein